MNNEVKDLTEEIKNQVKDISYVAYEASASRAERREKRLVRLIALLVVLLVGTNAGWLIYESQFEMVEETTETTITQDNESGYNNYIGNDGDITNGETDNQD